MAKRVIIVSYSFPPFGGVAGRRWTLFAKQLAENNQDVTVIACSQQAKKSNWDGKMKGVKVHYLPDFIPSILKKEPLSILGKVWYHTVFLLLKIVNKGHPYDFGFFWIKYVKIFIEKEGFNNNSNIIITGAPFSSFSLSYLLKGKGNRFILDYRDPYTWNNAYGFDELSNARKDFEKRKEKKALNISDVILVPNSVMFNELLSFHSHVKNKLHILAHPVDSTVEKVNKSKKSQDGKVRIIYAGRLYPECKDEIVELVDCIQNTEELIWDIFTDISKIDLGLMKLLSSSEKVNLYDRVSSKSLHQLFHNYDFYYVINPDRAKNYLSTKYCDLVFSEIPLLVKEKSGLLVDELRKLRHVLVFEEIKELPELIKENSDLDASSKEVEMFLAKYSGNVNHLMNIIKLS